MSFIKGSLLRARIAFAMLTIVALPATVNADPNANQLVTWQALCTGISEGTLTALSGTPAQCSSLPNRIVTWADITAAISTSGCPSGNPIPTWGQILGCRVSAGTGTLTSESFTFAAAAYTAVFHPVAGDPGEVGVSCQGPSASRLTLTLPSTTKAPTTSATQLSWAPVSSNENYTIKFEAPNGTVMASDAVAQGSTATVSYSGSSTAGAWQIVVTGLTANSCSNGNLSGTAGTATGTASWYE